MITTEGTIIISPNGIELQDFRSDGLGQTDKLGMVLEILSWGINRMLEEMIIAARTNETPPGGQEKNGVHKWK